MIEYSKKFKKLSVFTPIELFKIKPLKVGNNYPKENGCGGQMSGRGTSYSMAMES